MVTKVAAKGKEDRQKIAPGGRDGVREWDMVEDVDVLRGRLARRQRGHHGPAHARSLAWLFGLRWGAGIRRSDPGSRSALCARQRLRRQILPQAAGNGRHLAG